MMLLCDKKSSLVLLTTQFNMIELGKRNKRKINFSISEKWDMFGTKKKKQKENCF